MVAFEHFCALGDTPTVEISQQIVTVASFPHCSHVFRTIHTPHSEITPSDWNHPEV
jgi:hypothetical protein